MANGDGAVDAKFLGLAIDALQEVFRNIGGDANNLFFHKWPSMHFNYKIIDKICQELTDDFSQLHVQLG